MFVVACTPSETDTINDNSNMNKDNKNSLILALGTEPEEQFDPTLGWGRYGSPLFQSTLLTFDQQFDVKFDLATHYETDDKHLEWTVEIRDDAYFSNGELVTAEDVAFTYETAKNNQSIIDLQNLEEVEVNDLHTVTFKLKKPQSAFIYLLAMLGIVPKDEYSETYEENPIGSGPYQLVQWDKGQQLIVKANPHYYGEKSPFEKLTFLFLEEDAAFAAAKAGEVDVVAIPPQFAREEISNMTLHTFDSVDNRGIMFPYIKREVDNETGLEIGHDVTADIAIRKAINIAIDREQLIEDVLEGYGTPAYTVADKLPWWNEETVFEDGNIDEADQILTEAGWTKDETGIYVKNGLRASFPLVYPANDQTRQSLAIIVSQMMKEFGIEIEPVGKSWSDISDIMFSTPIIMGWGSHDPLEMYYIYHSENIGDGYHNANYYKNEIVDEYITEALFSVTEEEANEWWKKAQWDGTTGLSVKGDAPWAWLINLQHLYYINENLDIGEQKIQPHGHGWPITEFIANWQWKE